MVLSAEVTCDVGHNDPKMIVTVFFMTAMLMILVVDEFYDPVDVWDDALAVLPDHQRMLGREIKCRVDDAMHFISSQPRFEEQIMDFSTKVVPTRVVFERLV